MYYMYVLVRKYRGKEKRSRLFCYCLSFSANVTPSFTLNFTFKSLMSQQYVIRVTSDFKETFELSHLSLNGSTELCPPPAPQVKRDEADQLVSCHSCLRLELLLSAGDFHWDSGQYSRRHTERLRGLGAADWMKGRSNTGCKASPYCCPALSVCVSSRWD